MDVATVSLFGIDVITILQHFLNGLALGGIYALIALGYTMVYGILKFINFAHGEILMVGTYGAFFIYTTLISGGVQGIVLFLLFLFALICGMAISAVLGVVIEAAAYRPLRKASRLAPLLSAIGVSIILSNSAAYFFSTRSKRFPYPFDNTPFSISGLSVTPGQILTFVVCILMSIALKFFIDKTRIGKAMRAASENQNTAALMGINVNRIISITFAIGSALAVSAGVLYALEYAASPTMGTMIGLKAFTAAVVGGIGNISGAMLGGILIGVLETFGTAILGIPVGYKDTIAFGILILVLLLKPDGILGSNLKEKV